jgi:hypothetical protein
VNVFSFETLPLEEKAAELRRKIHALGLVVGNEDRIALRRAELQGVLEQLAELRGPELVTEGAR